MVKYYKKISIDKPWTQPVLTSNGTLGGNSFAVGGVTNIDETPASNFYKMFDKKTDGYYIQFVDSPANYITFYNPNRLKISSFTIYYYPTAHMGATLYGSDDNKNWTKIVDFNHTSNTQKTTISNPVGYLYHKIANIDGHGDNGYGSKIIADIYEITINATYEPTVWQECTKEEYDQLPDDDRKIVTDVYSIFSIAKFYKLTEVEKPWVQPVLSTLESLGGQYFTASTTHQLTGTQYALVNAFNNGSNFYAGTNSTSDKVQITFYNPYPLKVSSLYWVTRDANRYPKNWEWYGSNDNANWMLLDTGTNNANTFTLNFNVNNEPYKYHKYVIVTNNNGINAQTIRLTGEEYTETWQECTKEEYDQLPDNLRKQERGLYASKSNNKAYLGGGSQYLRKETIVRDIDLDFTKYTCSTNSTYGLSTTSHELRVLFVQGFNPNYFLVDNINAQLVQLHLRITASHIGGGDSICNHSLRLFYVDGTTKDFTSTNNGACMNSGSTEFIIPEQSKPFNKFQYFANEYYNTGYNVGCNAYLTFISAKEKRVVYTRS